MAVLRSSHIEHIERERAYSIMGITYEENPSQMKQL